MNSPASAGHWASSLSASLLFVAFAALATAVDASAAPAVPAFPGAEGYGALSRGGRGGRVLFVTNLDDSGPGSFRAACEADGPRIVVFRVAGTIALKRPITVHNPYLTVAGQTAPGDGICLRNATFGIATHDVVVRYLRSRLGDERRQEADAIDLFNGASNCIIDHCSATWSIDECLSTSGVDSHCTIQWCLIGEALNHSKHAKGPHGYGSLARANGPMSWHHNLWIDNSARNPRLGANYGKPPFPTFDVRNNVIYNYGGAATGLTEGSMHVNYVGNYIQPGPNTVKTHLPIVTGGSDEMAFYIRDNVVAGRDDLTQDNTKMFTVVEYKGHRIVTVVDQPFATAPVTTVPAEQAYDAVLASVGASRPTRDAVDARLVTQVRTGTGKIIDSQEEVGGWPELKQGTVPVDSDNDGIPDTWETAHHLNPRDPADAAGVSPSGYTNLEEYLNSLAG